MSRPPVLQAPHTEVVGKMNESGKKTSESTLPPPPLDPKPVRVKHFLIWCLCVDYGEESKLAKKLCKEDFLHFVDLARRCFLDKSTGSRKKVFTSCRTFAPVFRGDAEMPGEILDAEIKNELLEPAKALGVPEMVTLSELRMFVGSMRQTKRIFWRSRMKWLWQTYGPEKVVEKLLYDREVLFDTIFPPSTCNKEQTKLRQYLLISNLCMEQKWFSQLVSPDDFQTKMTFKRSETAFSAMSTLSLTKQQRIRTETKEETKFAILQTDRLRKDDRDGNFKCAHFKMRDLANIGKHPRPACLDPDHVLTWILLTYKRVRGNPLQELVVGRSTDSTSST